jgi:ureidoglycolate lyase
MTAIPMRRIVQIRSDNVLTAEPIDRAGFAPFGDLIDVEASGLRTDRIAGIENRRADARFHLSTIRIAPVALPLEIVELERHVFTSQSFLPLVASRYLVCVAKNDSDGWPDLQTLRAFAVPAGIGITYRAGTWHHPMLALDTPSSFAIVMWCGDDGNEEFVDLSRPVRIAPAATA